MTTFRLGDAKVDVARCEIRIDDLCNKVEPRSMDVLAFLATNNNGVVSQQRLFEALWPNTTFSQAAIQRCIAQLRRALGDDARNPRYILTHPKRGYSLIAQVEAIEDQKFSFPNNNNRRRFAALCLLLCLCIGVLHQTLTSNRQVNAFSGQLSPITTSGDYDFLPVYIKQGTALAFIRQIDQQGHIYVKDLASGEVKVVSQHAGDYQALAWDESLQRLYYVVRQHRQSQLGYLPLGAIEQAQTTLFSVAAPTQIWHVAPTSDNTLYVLQARVPANQPAKSELIAYQVATNTTQTILTSSQNYTPYRIALSPNSQTLAIAGENSLNQVEIRLFDLASGSLSPAIKQMPVGFTEISWHPDGEHLLVHYQNKLLLVALNGESHVLPYKHYQAIFNPVFSPDGKQIIFSLTNQDMDLIQLSLKTMAVTPLVNSNGRDHLARYSHSGNQIAYVSTRAGRSQVFISQNGQDTLVYDNPTNGNIFRPPVWSQDDKQLVFFAGTSLQLYDTRTMQLTTLPLPAGFSGVLDWYHREHALLINIKQNGSSYFARYDLSDFSHQLLLASGTNFHARLDKNDQLIYTAKGKLHLSDKAFVVSVELTGPSFPFGDGVVFQSGSEIIAVDAQGKMQRLYNFGDQPYQLVDVTEDQRLLLHTPPPVEAQLVSLQ